MAGVVKAGAGAEVGAEVGAGAGADDEPPVRRLKSPRRAGAESLWAQAQLALPRTIKAIVTIWRRIMLTSPPRGFSSWNGGPVLWGLCSRCPLR